MKKVISRRGSAAVPAREMPEIDFSVYTVKRNSYAARIAREGVELMHTGPSKVSLKDMPEVDFGSARVRSNKYVDQARKVASKIQYGKGRPRRGDEVGPTPARTLRLPKAVWQALEREAYQHSTTVHALLRELVVTHVTGLHSPNKGPRRKGR